MPTGNALIVQHTGEGTFIGEMVKMAEESPC